MGGAPVEITPLGDLLVWGGLAFLIVVGVVAILVPRHWRRHPRS